uniref:ORF-144 protein n=1 Tax=Lymantria dispar multicapsid nuclear polyhedrosis virus TaxID=10449 RepID=V9TGR1_NPVLD|nr:ORF-144 protein [Lymantria dispar multiple nucleopolyhedrovirus]
MYILLGVIKSVRNGKRFLLIPIRLSRSIKLNLSEPESSLEADARAARSCREPP